jgi:crotonobetainyl-CoA:carnitine CoA-transferase CaiB-like acyl-CoA transferase
MSLPEPVLEPVLQGLTVLDLAEGSAGPVATMLLADHGAEVVKVERPGGDPFRASAAYTVWNRSKRSVVLDLRDADDRSRFDALATTADVVIDSFAPRVADELGYDPAALRVANPRLVTCSITAYGREGAWRDRPGWDLLVQASSGMQWEQVGNRPGPVFLHAPLPSMGAALLAVSGITAALLERTQSGEGQHVETSLMQGALLWMTQMWTRASQPTDDLERMWADRVPGPTPNFEAGDGKWLHPMPMAVGLICEHVGHPLDEPPANNGLYGTAEEKALRHAALQALYRERPMQEWVDLMQAAGEPCQPVLPVEEGLRHFQVEHNRSATDVEHPGVGTVRQVGEVVHLSGHHMRPPVAPVPAGHDTDAILASLPRKRAAAPASPAVTAPPATKRGPLAGVRVLDFPLALAGPFATMLLADLGADVIGVHNRALTGMPVDITYAAGHRGKRSIAIDMKHPDGRAVAQDLIRHADVVHNNMRSGVSDRLGFGPADVHTLNPRAISSHLTAYGSSGPLGPWPGVDQMGQALSGLEWELGGTREGGTPNWYRYGMCDASSGMLAVIGIVEALLDRDRTGRGQDVESCILDAGILLSSDGFDGPQSLPRRPASDARQTGLGPRYRLYETAQDWLAVVAPDDEHWDALCAELGVARDAPVADVEQVFLTAKADDWFARLDARGVPCEVSREERGWTWYDDPEARARAWVVDYPHPVWGDMQQPGRFFDFSRTPHTPDSAPPVVGAHTVEILEEIGYTRERIDTLRAAGAIGCWSGSE